MKQWETGRRFAGHRDGEETKEDKKEKLHASYKMAVEKAHMLRRCVCMCVLIEPDHFMCGDCVPQEGEEKHHTRLQTHLKRRRRRREHISTAVSTTLY